jgi:hypothetical protein
MVKQLQQVLGEITRTNETGGGYQIDTTPEIWYNLGFEDWNPKTKTGTPKKWIPVEEGQSVMIEFTTSPSGKNYIERFTIQQNKGEVKNFNNRKPKGVEVKIDNTSRLIIRQNSITNACKVLEPYTDELQLKSRVERILEVAKQFESWIERDND